MRPATPAEYVSATMRAADKRYLNGGRRSLTVIWSDRGTEVASKTTLYTRGKIAQESYAVNPKYVGEGES